MPQISRHQPRQRSMQASLPEVERAISGMSIKINKSVASSRHGSLLLLGHLNLPCGLFPKSVRSCPVCSTWLNESISGQCQVSPGCLSDTVLVPLSGISFSLMTFRTSASEYFTDAVPSAGFGFVFQGMVFQRLGKENTQSVSSMLVFCCLNYSIFGSFSVVGQLMASHQIVVLCVIGYSHHN